MRRPHHSLTSRGSPSPGREPRAVSARAVLGRLQSAGNTPCGRFAAPSRRCANRVRARCRGGPHSAVTGCRLHVRARDAATVRAVGREPERGARPGSEACSGDREGTRVRGRDGDQGAVQVVPVAVSKVPVTRDCGMRGEREQIQRPIAKRAGASHPWEEASCLRGNRPRGGSLGGHRGAMQIPRIRRGSRAARAREATGEGQRQHGATWRLQKASTLREYAPGSNKRSVELPRRGDRVEPDERR